jgi:predicted RNase H-like HicB family nuclease
VWNGVWSVKPDLSSFGADAMKTFTAQVEFGPETNLYVGTVPGIRGAHTQAASLDELRDDLREVLELCIEEGQAGMDG